nr:lipoprotein [Kibdelosporangium sp. MJ126-NF4]
MDMSRRVVLGVCAIGVGTLLLSGCDGFQVASTEFSDTTDLAQKVAAVRIDNGSGAVRIRQGASASVKRTVSYRGQNKPGQSHRVDGDTLMLNKCDQNNCSIDYEVTLPVAAKVLGEVGSGEIEVTGMADVGVRSGSGDIRVRDVPGPVTVKVSSGRAELTNLGQSAVVEAGSGEVVVTGAKGDVTIQARSGGTTATGIEGKASIESSSGDVRLDMVTAQSAKVTAQSGAIAVTVPRGQAYKTDVKTSSGGKTINIDTSMSSNHVLDLEASSGDIQVDYR